MHDKMIMYEPWTSANETALGAYAHDSYAAINMHRRGEDDEPVDLTLRQIDDIHDAMRPTTRPLRVQRGLYADAFPGAATAGDIGDMVGKVFEDRGFLSTTIDPSYQRPGGRTNKIVYLELHVPEGTPAAYLGFPDGPGLEAERELLLDRGTRFVITGTDESSDGSRFVVTGRVLPRDEPLTAASAYGRKAAHLVKSAT